MTTVLKCQGFLFKCNIITVNYTLVHIYEIFIEKKNIDGILMLFLVGKKILFDRHEK